MCAPIRALSDRAQWGKLQSRVEFSASRDRVRPEFTNLRPSPICAALALGLLPHPRSSMNGTFVRGAVGALALFLAPMARPATAQNPPDPALEFAAGWVGFADDGIASERLVGAAARLYVLPRLSVGPEIVYIDADNHNHLTVTGNVTWDVVGPVNTRRLTPFLVAGAGVFRTRESFFSGTFTSTEGAFTAGGGVRASVGDRVTVGIDARIGWELHIRLNGLVGFWLGT